MSAGSASPEKAAVTLPGVVERVIKNEHTDEPEKAQIAVEGAEELYREIRIENTLHDENGKEVALKLGAQVDVTVEAPPEATTKKIPEKSIPQE